MGVNEVRDWVNEVTRRRWNCGFIGDPMAERGKHKPAAHQIQGHLRVFGVSQSTSGSSRGFRNSQTHRRCDVFISALRVCSAATEVQARTLHPVKSGVASSCIPKRVKVRPWWRHGKVEFYWRSPMRSSKPSWKFSAGRRELYERR